MLAAAPAIPCSSPGQRHHLCPSGFKLFCLTKLIVEVNLSDLLSLFSAGVGVLAADNNWVSSGLSFVFVCSADLCRRLSTLTSSDFSCYLLLEGSILSPSMLIAADCILVL